MRQPCRSILFMPGHRPDLIEKGIAAGADIIVLDLEDAVPVAEKAAARRTVAAAISDVRAEGHEVGLFVRPNALDTRLSGSDILEVAVPGLDGLFIPKVTSAIDVHRYLALVEHAEHVGGLDDLDLIVPVEMARAIVNIHEIVEVPRVSAVIGPTARHADIARAIGFEWTPEGTETLYLRSRILVAARAAGVVPLTGLWEDVHDVEGLSRFARQGRGMGFSGQIVIHPSHVAPVNEAYTPAEEEFRFYEGMIAAFEEAERGGSGALVYRGRHIDIAHVQTARDWLTSMAPLRGHAGR